MKKFLHLVLTVCLVLLCVTIFTACDFIPQKPAEGDGNTPHTHTYGEWVEVSVFEEYMALAQKRFCSTCGHVEYKTSLTEAYDVDYSKIEFSTDVDGNKVGTYVGTYDEIYSVTVTYNYSNGDKVKESCKVTEISDRLDCVSNEYVFEYGALGQLLNIFATEKSGSSIYKTVTYALEYNEEAKPIKRTILECADGGDILYKEIFDLVYGENGLLINTIEAVYQGGDNLESKEVCDFEYDKNGNCTKETYTHYSDETTVSRKKITEYQFDEFDNLVKETTINYDDGVNVSNKHICEFEYNKNGKVTKQTRTWFNDDVTLSGKEIRLYEYDNFDNQIKETCESYDNGVTLSSKYVGESEYNELGKCTKHTRTDYSDGVNASRKSVTEYEYDKTGNVIKHNYTEYDDGATLSREQITAYQYVDGQLQYRELTEKEYSENGVCLKESYTKYDKDDDVVDESVEYHTHTYGEWIKELNSFETFATALRKRICSTCNHIEYESSAIDWYEIDLSKMVFSMDPFDRKVGTYTQTTEDRNLTLTYNYSSIGDIVMGTYFIIENPSSSDCKTNECVFEYNKIGQFSRISDTCFKGDVIDYKYVFEFTRNAKCDPIEVIEFMFDSSINELTQKNVREFVYDENGKFVQQIYTKYDANGEVVGRTIYYE